MTTDIRINGKLYSEKKTYNCYLAIDNKIETVIIKAYTKGEGRSRLKIIYNLDKLPLGTKLTEVRI